MEKSLVALVVCACVCSPSLAAPTGTVTMKYPGYSAAPYATVSLYADSDGSYDDAAGTGYEVAFSGGIAAGFYKHDVTAATGSGARRDSARQPGHGPDRLAAPAQNAVTSRCFRTIRAADSERSPFLMRGRHVAHRIGYATRPHAEHSRASEDRCSVTFPLAQTAPP